MPKPKPPFWKVHDLDIMTKAAGSTTAGKIELLFEMPVKGQNLRPFLPHFLQDKKEKFAEAKRIQKQITKFGWTDRAIEITKS